jgi:hypothetical protein
VWVIEIDGINLAEQNWRGWLGRFDEAAESQIMGVQNCGESFLGCAQAHLMAFLAGYTLAAVPKPRSFIAIQGESIYTLSRFFG